MEVLDKVIVSPNTIVADWRREVKWNNIDGFWHDTRAHLKQLLKDFMETIMRDEVLVYTGREWNKKLAEKIDYRNGYPTGCPVGLSLPGSTYAAGAPGIESAAAAPAKV